MVTNPSRHVIALLLLLTATVACAWGPDGHHTVGAIAGRLLAGSPAQAQVKALLSTEALEVAAVWADCAKGVDPTKGFQYTAAGKYTECAPFETPESEAEMIDFVRRNDTNCPRVPGDESCHKQYHYTDEAEQHASYHEGDVGTRPFDIVAAVAATIAVLQGQSAPAPFNIKDKKEALRLLAHYAGDIEQPLHVGAVYLTAAGQPVDPDQGTFDPATGTRGGNEITAVQVDTHQRQENLHATWDDVPPALRSDRINAAWIKLAASVPITQGPIDTWSSTWATETLGQARTALSSLAYGPQHNGLWTVPLNSRYDTAMNRIKKQQLTRGGARLAQVLRSVWPDSASGRGPETPCEMIGVFMETVAPLRLLIRANTSLPNGSSDTSERACARHKNIAQ